MITEKQYAAILDAIDKAKQELLLKLTEIMESEESDCESCLWAYDGLNKYWNCTQWYKERRMKKGSCRMYVRKRNE